MKEKLSLNEKDKETYVGTITEPLGTYTPKYSGALWKRFRDDYFNERAMKIKALKEEAEWKYLKGLCEEYAYMRYLYDEYCWVWRRDKRHPKGIKRPIYPPPLTYLKEDVETVLSKYHTLNPVDMKNKVIAAIVEELTKS